MENLETFRAALREKIEEMDEYQLRFTLHLVRRLFFPVPGGQKDARVYAYPARRYGCTINAWGAISMTLFTSSSSVALAGRGT